MLLRTSSWTWSPWKSSKPIGFWASALHSAVGPAHPLSKGCPCPPGHLSCISPEFNLEETTQKACSASEPLCDSFTVRTSCYLCKCHSGGNEATIHSSVGYWLILNQAQRHTWLSCSHTCSTVTCMEKPTPSTPSWIAYSKDAMDVTNTQASENYWKCYHLEWLSLIWVFGDVTSKVTSELRAQWWIIMEKN